MPKKIVFLFLLNILILGCRTGFVDVENAEKLHHLLILKDHKEFTKVLSCRPELANVIDDKRVPVLVWASYYGDTEAVTILLDHGAEIDMQTGQNRTALYFAAGEGHFEMVKLLLEKGAEINLRNSKKRTALHHAATGGFHETVLFLIQKGAEVDIKDINGETPLHLAVKKCSFETIKVLLEAKANPKITNKKGKTPYELAEKTELVDIIALFKPNDSK